MTLATINVDGAHRYLLGLAQREASSKLGVPVKLQNFSVHLSNLSVDLYGIRVAGASPHPNPPLLEVNRIQVSVRIVSILRRHWYLDDLRIDHPVVWIMVGKNGVSNLPAIKSDGGSKINVFTLGIRHALLDRGEIYYNSRPSAIAADLHHLLFQASFNSRLQMYSGNLSYTGGHLKYRSYRPVAHNLYVRFDATPSIFRLTEARLSSAPLQAVLSGAIEGYRTHPVAQVKYSITVNGARIAALLNRPALPAGILRTSGSLSYRDQVGRPLLETITVNGDLASQRIRVSGSGMRAALTNVVGHYSLVKGEATLSYLHASVLGGEATAHGTMKNIGGGDAHSQFNAALRGVSLAALQRTIAPAGTRTGIEVSGALNATASASWGKTFGDMVAQADAKLSGKLTRARTAQGNGAHLTPVSAVNGAASPAAIPVNSVIHAIYVNRNHTLELANSYLRTSQTNLKFNGTVGKRSRLAVQFQTKDLGELAAMANAFRTHVSGAAPLELAGSASFQGAVQGSTLAPRISGQLTAENLRVRDTSWKYLRATIDASPNGVGLQQGELEAASQGRIAFNGSAGLKDWKFSRSSQFQIQLDASRLDIGKLAQLSGKSMPVTGNLSANIHVHGSEENPEGNGTLSLTRLTVYRQPIQSAKLNLSAAGNQMKADALVQLLSGELRVDLTVQPKQKTYMAQVSSHGIHIGQLQFLKERGVKASGVLALNASGQGSFSDPQFSAGVQIPSLTVGTQTVSGLKLQMNVAHHVANAALTSTALNTSIKAKAKVNLSGDYPTTASLDTNVIQLQPLLAIYSPGEASNLTGQTEIHATLQGPLRERKLLQAQVTIPILKAAYGVVHLAAVSPIRGDYKNGAFDLQPAVIRGTDTNLQLQASIPVAGNAPMSLKVHGSIDLQLAQLVDPLVHSSGQIRFNIDSHGPVTQGNVGGEIDIVNASFTPPNVPIGLQNGNGVLKLSSKRLNIAKFQASVGGGTITASGGVDYRPKLHFDVGVVAKDVRILYPQGLRESIDANLRLNGSPTYAVLGGAVDLADISFTPGFDLTSFVGKFSSGVAAPPAQGFSQNLKLNIAVHAANNIDLASRTFSVNGSANIEARGTAAQPVILGRVNLTGGDIILHGDRFVLTGGTVQFVNPSRTEPVLNITLTTSIQQYNIDLHFSGPVEQMRSEYTSNPALPSVDIIHLLAFGQTTEAAANNPTPANQEAESLIASQVSSQVTSRIAKVAGISQLSINPVLSGNSEQGPAGAQIAIQQRVTGNLFITFTSNVATTQDQTIEGEYRISPRVSLSATRDPNGGFALDTLIKKTW
ncbi:MAG: translocation/assembly module TamB domain-containing protein [Terracidiphilus sp.]